MCYALSMNKIIATAKLTTNGDSTTLELSKEVLTVLQSNVGDTVQLTETPNGVLISRYNIEFAKIMDAAEIIMCEEYDTLRALSK
jgi:hypothetical protein